MKRKSYRSYYLNEDDAPYPRVAVEYVDRKEDVRTFAQAKRDLMSTIAYHISHWRGVLQEARAVRKVKIDADYEAG